MPDRNQGSGDARIALVASWAIVVVVVVQGTLSMLTQTADELMVEQRVTAIVSGLAAAALFTLVQLRTLRDRAVVPWMPWLGVLLASIAFIIGAWLGASLALGIIALMLTGMTLWEIKSPTVLRKARHPRP